MDAHVLLLLLIIQYVAATRIVFDGCTQLGSACSSKSVCALAGQLARKELTANGRMARQLDYKWSTVSKQFIPVYSTRSHDSAPVGVSYEPDPQMSAAAAGAAYGRAPVLSHAESYPAGSGLTAPSDIELPANLKTHEIRYFDDIRHVELKPVTRTESKVETRSEQTHHHDHHIHQVKQ